MEIKKAQNTFTQYEAMAETIKEFGISVEQYQELCRIATK